MGIGVQGNPNAPTGSKNYEIIQAKYGMNRNGPPIQQMQGNQFNHSPSRGFIANANNI